MDLFWIILEAVIKSLVIFTMILLAAATLVYVERRVSAFIQNRLGPNRVGPAGLLQPFADVFKLFFKEDIVPKAADNRFHRLAPVISLGVAVAVYAVIPFANYVDTPGGKIFIGIAPYLNIGVLFILAMSSVGVYGLTFAGWSSNNKYSLMGGLRASAQMISYELSMGLSLIGVIMVSSALPISQSHPLYNLITENPLSLSAIVEKQSGFLWNLFLQPIGFITFLVAAFAETNRTPFDLPEAEPELVGGFNTEYSGMKFGMFFLAEYGNMATASAIIALVYLGGWQLPFSYEAIGLQYGTILLALVQFFVFMIKVAFLCFFFVWVRWSVPRFRYDQLMNLGWKVMLPVSLINVIITGLVIYILKMF